MRGYDSCGNKQEGKYVYVNGLVQDCSISSALAIEVLLSCSKHTMCVFRKSLSHDQLREI